MEDDPNQEKIRAARDALKEACEKLKNKNEDDYLFFHDVNERSITHRLAIYLEQVISRYYEERRFGESEGWSVDCEYNRMANGKAIDKKRLNFNLERCPEDGSDTHARTVYPDIIVHRRGRSGEDNNLLVIEAKKSTSSSENDKEKLKAYCSQPQLNYLSAALVIFEVGERGSGEDSTTKKVVIKWLDRESGKFEND